MKKLGSNKLCCFPINKIGIIVDYDDNMEMPGKILEMGLLPNTFFRILYQAPFNGPLYIEYGEECSKVALREDEAIYIIVEGLEDGK